MKGFILATKVKSSSYYDEKKLRRVSTELEIKPCFVTLVRKPEVDGYAAVQIGFASRTAKNIGKATLGITKKAGIETPLSYFTEVRLTEAELAAYTPGQELTSDKVFAPNDLIEVTGTTKGKGFQGVVKRHGFKGGPKTHGQSDRTRAPGAIGSGTTPGRIWKGKRMAGRMGGVTKTITGLSVVKAEGKQLVVRGLVPGPIGGVILVKTVA